MSVITTLEATSFKNTGLTGVLVLPPSLERIESQAFAGVTTLTGITIYDNVSYIAPDAFSPALNNPSVTITVQSASSYAYQFFSTNFPQATIIVVVCFLEGSRILAEKDGKLQYLPIESLREGDFVETYLHGRRPIAYIASTTIHPSDPSVTKANRLFRVCKSHFHQLDEDLFVTGGHGILVKDPITSLLDSWKDDTPWQRILVDSLEKCLDQEKTRGDKIDGLHRIPAYLYGEGVEECCSLTGPQTIWHVALKSVDETSDEQCFGIYAHGGILVESCSEVYIRKYMK
jgi:hypothetical protein